MRFIVERGDENAGRIMDCALDRCVAQAARTYALDPDKGRYTGDQVLRQLAYGALVEDIALRNAKGLFRTTAGE